MPKCENCGKEVEEVCSGGYCKACHKSITWEDCITDTSVARRHLHASLAVDCGLTRKESIEHVKSIYPAAKFEEYKELEATITEEALEDLKRVFKAHPKVLVYVTDELQERQRQGRPIFVIDIASHTGVPLEAKQTLKPLIAKHGSHTLNKALKTWWKMWREAKQVKRKKSKIDAMLDTLQ